MKISLNWLHDFLPSNYTAEELDVLLTDTGLEVEGFETVETVKGGLAGVVVAEVLTCEQHPNADRLKVTTVNNGKEVLQVVCGAPNVAAGQKVILAQVGATLYPQPDQPLKMKVSKIRDVESHGMLCAEDELGLGQSHDGILILDAKWQPGTPAAEVFQVENDVQIEIGLTPNRADAMGHIGVARDVLAHSNCHQGTSHRLSLEVPEIKVDSTANTVAISVENSEKCPRYMGITMSGVKIGPSPAWLQNRLRTVGVQPINNVVDVTNYVMRELGTPLHAFDANVVNGKVVVRTAKPGEKLITLDGIERQLHEEDLVIANATDAMCIAGVFGGSTSGVSEQTTAIFLEAAYFQPVSVRKTAKRHGLSTDASFRFERGVDPNLIPVALAKAVKLIQEVAGGEVGMNVVDSYPSPIENKSVELRLSRLASVLGWTIEPSTIETVLTSLDINIVSKSEDNWTLSVPPYRVDVDREIDVIEEVLRIVGFNQVPIPSKLNSSISFSTQPDIERLTISLSEVLVGIGFREMMNNSLTSPVYVEKFGKEALKREEAVELLNPLSQELAVMRQSLVFQTLETVAHNQNRQHADVWLYEFGKTYFKKEAGYAENKRLLLALTGKRNQENWTAAQGATSFFTMKGAVQSALSRLGLDSLLNEEPIVSDDVFQDGLVLRILKNEVGRIGWVKTPILKHFGVKSAVFVADLDWDTILDSLKLSKTIYKELPKTFSVRRDFSLLLNSSVRFSEIESLARKSEKKLLKEVKLFDVYEGKNLPEGKKSYAVSFHFQDAEQTLKDEQIDKMMSSIQVALEKELGAELRS